MEETGLTGLSYTKLASRESKSEVFMNTNLKLNKFQSGMSALFCCTQKM